jgi:flagellar biosynthesis protein FlhF
VQLASARAAADQRRAAAPAARRAEAPVAPPSVFDETMDDDGAMDSGFDTPVPRRAAPRAAPRAAMPAAHVPVLHDELPALPAMRMPRAAAAAPSQAAANHLDMVNELRSMKGLIEERFGALAFMEKLQRQPRQALLAQKMLDCGFSPALIRKLVDALPASATDEIEWAAGVLERNLATSEAEAAIEDQGGVYALVGSTGVGKTTSTAKIAAGFAARHGANQLGLITLDAYRVGAHEQLRAYGRILGVPVHTAHDRASLEDLLELLANKKMVLIDTAGMAQRDSRTRELLEMLQHRSIKRLLVIDAAAQGETIEDVIVNWRAAECKGVVLSKIDEAVKLAPALDALIRHKLKNVGVANGQRVPEDWHRLSANALVHRALKAGGSPAWRMDPQDVHLVFANAGLNTTAASALRI